MLRMRTMARCTSVGLMGANKVHMSNKDNKIRGDRGKMIFSNKNDQRYVFCFFVFGNSGSNQYMKLLIR